MSKYKEISDCEVCGNKALEKVLDLGNHPMCDDLVPVGDVRVCKEYPIEILYCDLCRTAHQRFQIPKYALFPKSYHYRARFTADVLNGMSELVEATEQHLGALTDKLVLDIGCNDGSLLDFFKTKGAKTIGVEPTNASQDASLKGHDVINDFFSIEVAEEIKNKFGCPDIVTFTNVFAHIENLPEVIDALKHLMSPSTVIIIENHYLGAVLDLNQFDTFYHEHPRTYSLTSFKYIAKSLGVELKGVDFPSRYGGNIRIFMGGNISSDALIGQNIKVILEKEIDFHEKIKNLNGFIATWKSETKKKINKLAMEYGKLSAKAFPGRAAILVKLLDLDNNLIEAVYEKPGSMKIGHYVPGTRIPIKSDEKLFFKMGNIKVILNLAWHINDEIEKYLIESKFSGEIVNILNYQEK